MTASPSTGPQNYTLGRGSLYFEPFTPNTTVLDGSGEQFFGDCNAVDFTFKVTDLDHYSSIAGIKEIDASIPLQVDRSGTFTTEDINPANLAKFFLGSSSIISVTGGSITNETLTSAVLPDRYYQLGETAANPSGNRDIATSPAPVVTNGLTSGALVTYVENTDYVIDYAAGSLYTVPGGAIVSGILEVTSYTTVTQTHDHVVSGNTPISGKLRFRSANPAGPNRDVVIPYCRINPNGSFNLIADKLTALQFDLKILKKGGTGGEAVYIDGRGVS
jgi:hypothetical protein